MKTATSEVPWLFFAFIYLMTLAWGWAIIRLNDGGGDDK